MREAEIYYRAAELFGVYSGVLKGVPESIAARVCDIRLKVGQPPALCTNNEVLFLSEGGLSRHISPDTHRTERKEIDEIIYRLCDCSVYSREEEIRNGFVSTKAGFRVGICGSATLENGKIKTLKDVTTLCLRLPREKKGCADGLAESYEKIRGGVLIAGEPSSGKTTFLRDLVQSLSSGKFGIYRRIAVLDERREIGGFFELGPLCDVLAGYPKAAGVEMAMRCLSPQVIACDEIGARELDAVEYAAGSGVEMIAAVHASKRDFLSNGLCKRLVSGGFFETVVFLKGRNFPAQTDEIRTAGELCEAFRGVANNHKRVFGGLYGVKVT